MLTKQRSGTEIDEVREFLTARGISLSGDDRLLGIRLLEDRYRTLHFIDYSERPYNIDTMINPYFLIAMFDYASFLKIIQKRGKYGDLIKDETVEHSWEHLLKEFGELLIAKSNDDDGEFMGDLIKVIQYALEKRKLGNDRYITEELFDLANTCRIQFIQRMKEG